MSVASLKLCLELYELSGWIGAGQTYASSTEQLEWLQNKDGSGWHLPAYDLGYLLRKLEELSSSYSWSMGYNTTDTDAYKIAMYQNMGNGFAKGVANTPEDAVAMLAIELFKQGILKRDGDA